MAAANSAALKAKRTAIKLAVLALNEDGRLVASDQTETCHVVFDANVLSDIEDMFDGVTVMAPKTGENGEPILGEDGKPAVEPVTGIMAWVHMNTSKPIKTMRDTLALCLGRDASKVGAALISSEMESYGKAVGYAFALANGGDPKDVEMEMLTQEAKAKAKSNSTVKNVSPETVSE